MRCKPCDVAWAEGDVCWNCGLPASDSVIPFIGSGPVVILPTPGDYEDMDPMEAYMTWAGLV